MVCWGAQSYCRVKGVGEQRVGLPEAGRAPGERRTLLIYSKVKQPCLSLPKEEEICEENRESS